MSIKTQEILITDEMLATLSNNTTTKLEIVVIDAIKAYHIDDRYNFIYDVCCFGCQSGVVGFLCYNSAYAFYDEHYEDIEDLRIGLAEDLGEEIKIGNRDLKVFFAHLAFEEITRRIADVLELDI